MPRRKKQSLVERSFSWLKTHRYVSYGLIALLLVLIYVLFHVYQIYSDERKLNSARSAIDQVYSDISARLGRPDNLKRSSTCGQQAQLLHSSTVCTVETDFIYGVSNETQADIFLKQIQEVIAKNKKLFRPTQKLSTAISSNLVFDTYYHDALDTYRGPYGIACSVKYSYNTPDEVDLSLQNTSLQPFEVFFSCSSKSVKAVY